MLARKAIIQQNASLRLIEQPEYKRRWTVPNFDEQQKQALQQFLLSVLEKILSSQPEIMSATQAAKSALKQARANEAALLLFGTHAELELSLAALAVEDAVPYVAAQRYNEEGLQKRARWEETWELQRQEDREQGKMGNGEQSEKGREQKGEETQKNAPAQTPLAPLGPFPVPRSPFPAVPVPPKYDPKDFRENSFWRHRGKLDVPKERFISYPSANKENDAGLLIGWAGWNHLQRATALAALYQERKTQDAWGKAELTPLLAGLQELIPWVKQWHNEPNADYDGARLGDYFATFLEGELRELGLSFEDLNNWRPVTAAAVRANKAAEKKESARVEKAAKAEKKAATPKEPKPPATEGEAKKRGRPKKTT
jgi:hypothetical protein